MIFYINVLNKWYIAQKVTPTTEKTYIMYDHEIVLGLSTVPNNSFTRIKCRAPKWGEEFNYIIAVRTIWIWNQVAWGMEFGMRFEGGLPGSWFCLEFIRKWGDRQRRWVMVHFGHLGALIAGSYYFYRQGLCRITTMPTFLTLRRRLHHWVGPETCCCEVKGC